MRCVTSGKIKLPKDILVVGNSVRTMFRFRKHVFDRLRGDFNITIFAPVDLNISQTEDYSIKDSKLTAKRSITIVRIFRFLINFRSELRNGYDFVLIYGVGMAVLSSLFLYFFRKRNFKVIFLFTGLGAIFIRPRYRLIKYLLIKFIIPKVPDKIIVLNECDRRYVRIITRNTKNVEISLMNGEGLPDQMALLRSHEFSSLKRLVFVSRPFYDKGCAKFEKLVRLLRENEINIPISVYGFDRKNAGELRPEYFKNLEDLGCSFEGTVTALETELCNEDLVLIISDREGANRVLLECLHLRLCFLASSVAGIKNFVPEEIKSVSLLKYTDMQEAVLKIKWFLDQSSLELQQYISSLSRVRLYWTNDELEDFYRKEILQ